MTAEEFIQKCNIEFGLSNSWPKFYRVDLETYKNICLFLIQHTKNKDRHRLGWTVHIEVGLLGGVMFRGMEILLED